MIFYNDNDPFCCAWLRNLIAAGEIPDGIVCEKGIEEVKEEDLEGCHQCHFFAGIGGWPLALQLAGFDPGRPVWTGSCPCQPFSAAGKGEGEEDARHLWPAFFALIRQHKPDLVFGEQINARAGYEWLDGVRADLESEGFTFGAADIPAACAGAPHIRGRLFWVASRRVSDAERAGIRHEGRGEDSGKAPGVQGKDRKRQRVRFDFEQHGKSQFSPEQQAIIDKYGYWPGPCPDCGAKPGEFHTGNCPGPHAPARGVEHAASDGRQQGRSGTDGRGATSGCGTGRLGQSTGHGDGPPADGGSACQGEGERRQRGSGGSGAGDAGGVAIPRRSERRGIAGEPGSSDGEAGAGASTEPGRPSDLVGVGNTECPARRTPSGTGFDDLDGDEAGRSQGASGSELPGTVNHWSDYRLIPCRDDKVRRIGRLVQPLAARVPSRSDDECMEYLLARLVELGHSLKAAKRILREARGNRIGRLRGAGNAIVPQVAATFIRALLEIEKEKGF